MKRLFIALLLAAAPAQAQGWPPSPPCNPLLGACSPEARDWERTLTEMRERLERDRVKCTAALETMRSLNVNVTADQRREASYVLADRSCDLYRPSGRGAPTLDSRIDDLERRVEELERRLP